MCTISSNRLNGILCQGKYNCTKIIDNTEISFNKLAGIRVSEESNDNDLKKVIFFTK